MMVRKPILKHLIPSEIVNVEERGDRVSPAKDLDPLIRLGVHALRATCLTDFASAIKHWMMSFSVLRVYARWR